MTQNNPSYTADERAAMRAYLQRSEVRLSTMHRVAGAFLGGAGLLFLLPVLFRDVVQQIITLLVNKGNTYLSIGDLHWYYYLALGVPFLVSIYIPLRALYLLLQDLVDFYFLGHRLGYSQDLFSPRFALSGIAFSPDESETAKKEIIQHEIAELLNFVLPFEEAQAAYFDEVKAQAGDLIIPSTRTRAYLAEKNILQTLPSNRKERDVDRFNVAFGLAGVIDRSLVEEVAKTETSLVRHALSLRRLVLRYAKALLAVIWTTLISFCIVSLSNQFDEPVAIIAAFYCLWAVCIWPILRLPIKWIYQSAGKNTSRVEVNDRQLVKFEHEVSIICAITAVIAAAVFIMFLIYK
jgi:hypothetical protein